MKRLGVFGIAKVLALVFCVFLIALTGCSNGTTSNNRDMPIVCLGDSLTAGRSATTPGVDDMSKAYPAFLQEKVKIPVINAGVSGNTTSQGLARVDSDVLSHDPQIVIIFLGANDLGWRIPLATIRDNLQGIINRVDNGNRKIYLTKVFSGIDASLTAMFGGVEYAAIIAMLGQFDDMLNTLASQNNVTVIEDIWKGISLTHISADNIHPNAAGYEIMANNILNAIRPYLREKNLLK